jgi:cobyrinic acid a,c-diamide synthase
MKGCVIAGTSSGCGKTTVASGVMAALASRGYSVAPFKAGPDYIDTGFHRKTSGRASVNLDIWLCGEENVKYLYGQYAKGCDIGIVEGVMGLYDGLGALDTAYSTAHTAKTLGLPVILVVDGYGMSTSAAAIVSGFRDFDSDVEIAGVIFNRVSSEGHYLLLKRIIEGITGVPCLGYLPYGRDFNLPERHLGLVPACEMPALDEKIQKISDAVQKHIDLDRLAERCASPAEAEMPKGLRAFMDKSKGAFRHKRIGIALDEAFHFYYRPNLDLLRTLGAEIVEVSPLKDAGLPELDALYIGGGFPEVYAGELSGNAPFRNALRKELEEGLKCYAECGGLMYLCSRIADKNGETHEMTGFFPADAVMTETLQHFGYMTATTPAGNVINAHEFHFSMLHEKGPLNCAGRGEKPDGEGGGPCFIGKGNTLAGYPHLHFFGNPNVLLELL